MSVTVVIKVEDVTTQLVTYDKIQLVRAASATGIYALITTLTLVDGTYYYTYDDPTSNPELWYRYRLYNSVSFAAGSWSNPFQPEVATLREIRQRSIKTFRAGRTFTASGGTTATV